MAIKKIISIKNAGRLKNYNASGDVEFKKFTLIYGENGRGKTTLCAILRSLQDGNSAHIIGRKTLGVTGVPSVHIQLETSQVQFRDLVWTQTLPNLLIFDQEFISENVYSGNSVGTDQRRNLYKIIIGSEGVQLAKQYEEKKEEISGIQSRIRSVTQTIQSHLPAELTINAFVNMQNNDRIDSLIESAQRDVTAGSETSVISSHQALKQLTVLAIPINLQETLNLTLEAVSSEAEGKIRQHIATHTMGKQGQAWISQGLQFNCEPNCPFCGQDITSNELVELYKQYFSEAYAQLKASLIQQGVTFANSFGDRQIQEIISGIQENVSLVQFWKRYLDIEDLPELNTNSVRTVLSEMKEATLVLLRSKATNPLEIVPLDERFNTALQGFNELTDLINAYNQICARSNEAIATKKSALQNINLPALQATLRRLELTKRRFEEPLQGHCVSLQELQRQKNEFETQKSQIKAQLDTYSSTTFGRYQLAINEYLEKFNAGFSTSNVDPNFVGGANAQYQIVINNSSIRLGDDRTPSNEASFKNTLSSGDKSTLALALFLAQIENHPNKENLILLIDDPFNSQDSFRRNQTAIEIFRSGRQCKQTIVLSHDAHFLQLVKDKIHDAPVKTLQFIPLGADNSDIKELDLERHLRPELRVLIDKLQIYRSDGTGDPNDVVQKLRPLLEGHCRNLCMTLFNDQAMLSEILTHIRANQINHPLLHLYDELSDINDYTCRHHHADGSITHIVDQGELSGYVRRTLRLVGAH
jgi:wobble nucleotide-excising tRNase